MGTRNPTRKTLYFITFPLRAFTLFHEDRWGLSSLATERFDYAADGVTGYCLDVGCVRNNRFVTEYFYGNGIGVDLFSYEGLSADNIVEDLSERR